MKRLGIRARMLLAALAPLGLISTLLALIFLAVRFDDLQSAYEQRGRSMARQLAMASEYGLFSNNREQLRTLAAGVRLESDVRWVAVLDRGGQILASSGDAALAVSPGPGRAETGGSDDAHQTDWLVQPVLATRLELDDLFEKSQDSAAQQPFQLGQVVLVFSRQSLQQRKNQMLLLGAAVGALGLLFGIALALALSRGVIRPVLEISQLVERIGRGDFAAVERWRERDAGDDPFQSLQSNVIRMARRLAAARDELEQQVSLATHALREKKDEAEQANQAKSRFLAAASHDLRQPTHALGLFVSRLAQLPHDPVTTELIGNLDASVRAMQNLLDGLLDVSRLEARAVQVNRRSFALSILFDQLVQDLGPKAQQKGLRFIVRPTRLWVTSDAALLYRILLNLVSNALRYTRRGGVLIVARPCAGGSQVALQVWDTGIGIAEQHQSAIFTEFYQVANPARDRAQGMGLGLNIVHRTAELLGHSVSLSSRLGRGSRFSLTLPLATPQPALSAEAPREVPAADHLVGQTVWVIEDDALARSALAGLLASWGMQVAQASGSPEALALAAGSQRPDLILSDYRLQEATNGLDLVQALREALGMTVPACLMSGDTDPALIQRVQAAGLTLLHKPVRPAKLRSLLRHLLQDQRPSGADRS